MKIILVVALLLVPLPAGAQVSKSVVTDETQLPRFAYPMPTPPSTLLTASDAAFAPFLAAVESDVAKTLASYDIEDKSTLRDYLSTQLAGKVLNGDAAGVRSTVAQLRGAETKASSALLAGRLQLAYVSGDFAAQDRVAVNALPWGTVADSVKGMAAFEPIATSDAIVAEAGHDLDPIAAKTGTLDGPSARELVQLRAQLTLLPLLAQDAKILQAYIAAHNVTKPDIWATRDVTLKASQIKAPVRVGILDSGVDPKDYPGLMYGGASAAQHGLAFADDGAPSSLDTYPLPPDVAADYPKLVKVMTGLSDLGNGISSPQAAAAAAYMRSMNVTQREAFEREMDFVGEYSHGSHVAGIASRGNPGARIVVMRFDDNLPNLPFAPTTEWANRMADDFAAIGAFLRAKNVRVVNMSWGDQVSEFEQWLAKTASISSAQERKAKAQELYAIWRGAIAKMIADTPGTLFVAAAGNGDNDASFAQDVPSSLNYPNLITVGAVNQAGEATSFTSYGPTVAVYADGFHVPSKIPQGYIVQFSGTSMAAPNVTNLAAKLFALDPKLTPQQVRDLIVRGATPVAGSNLKLIDAKASVKLLKSR